MVYRRKRSQHVAPKIGSAVEKYRLEDPIIESTDPILKSPRRYNNPLRALRSRDPEAQFIGEEVGNAVTKDAACASTSRLSSYDAYVAKRAEWK